MKTTVIAVTVALVAGTFGFVLGSGPTTLDNLSVSVSGRHLLPDDWPGAVVATPPPVAPSAPLPSAEASAEELKQADARAWILTRHYGLTPKLVNDLTRTTYNAALIANLTSPEQRTTLHQLVIDYVEHGGSGLWDIGIDADDEVLVQQIGGGHGASASLSLLTSSQITEGRAEVAILGLSKYALGQ
jgi:hypothetical protein